MLHLTDLPPQSVPAVEAFARRLAAHVRTHREASLEVHEHGVLTAWRAGAVLAGVVSAATPHASAPAPGWRAGKPMGGAHHVPRRGRAAGGVGGRRRRQRDAAHASRARGHRPSKASSSGRWPRSRRPRRRHASRPTNRRQASWWSRRTGCWCGTWTLGRMAVRGTRSNWASSAAGRARGPRRIWRRPATSRRAETANQALS